MNFSNKNQYRVGQNEIVKQKPQKNDLKLQKGSSLYFPVGLLLAFLFSYALLEMEFMVKPVDLSLVTINLDNPDMYDDITFKVYEEEQQKAHLKQDKEKKLLTKNIRIIKNGLDGNFETPKIITEAQDITRNKLNPDDVNVYTYEEEPDPVSIVKVEEVPIYPGCEKYLGNSKRRKCLSDKIGILVFNKFNRDIAVEHGLTGKQSILVDFKIDKNGNVSHVVALSKHELLSKEAERVVTKIPKMKPGKQGGKKVEVLYTLPITFQIIN